MANETGKPVLKLEVETEQFDDLVKRVEKYRDDIKELPADWAAQGEGIARIKTGFEGAADSFARVQRYANDSKITGNSSFITGFAKQSDKAEKSWIKIKDWTEKTQKSLTGIARLAIVSGARGGLFGGVAGLVGGGVGGALVAGTVGAASSLAQQNADMRALGLKPGEQGAFETEFAKFGGTDDTLEKAAEAKRNKTFGAGLGVFGISLDQVGSLSTADLAKLMLQKGGERYRSLGDQGGAWAASPQVSPYFSGDQLQKASSYSTSDYQKANEEFAQLVPKLALAQDAYDKGTEALKRFNAALKEDETALLAVFTPLLDPISKLAKEFSDAVVAFAKSDEIKDDMNQIVDGFKEFIGFLKQLHIINDDKKNDVVSPDVNAVTQSGQITGNWLENEFPSYKAWRQRQSDWLGPDNDNGLGTGTTDGNTGTTGPVTTNRNKILDVIQNIESGGRYGQRNASSGAAGLYGLKPASAPGVNPDDPVAARNAANSILQGYMNKYHGDLAKSLAAYDGDTHIDADTKKFNGDWIKGAKPESVDYLKKAENQGINLGLSKEDQGYIDSHTSVKGSAAAREDYQRTKAYASPVAEGQAGMAPQTPGMTDGLLRDIAQSVDNLARTMTGIFRTGGGSQYASPDTAPNRTSQTVKSAVKLKVDVNTPAGSDTAVTTGSQAY